MIRTLERIQYRPNDYALKGDVPELYEVTFPNLSKYSVYRFDDMEKWILFILHNRKYIVTGGNIKLEKLFDSINNNDLIIGPIADDNVETQLPKFAENKLPFEVIMQQLLVANLGSQWVIKSQGLLSYCNIKQIDLITRTRFTREGLQQEIKQIEMNYEGRTTYIRDIVERYV